MKKKLLIIIVVALIVVSIVLGVNIFLNHREGRESQIMYKEFEGSSINPVENPVITVIYDNNPYKEGLESSWGFSCLIKGAEKNILFDTGGNGLLFMKNMKKLEIDPDDIDLVILSHIHGDHIGGLYSFLDENNEVVVYIPGSFPESFKENIEKYGTKAVKVKEPLELCKSVYSTGELGTWIREQSLIVQTNKGLIVITGCAHPGIVKIISKAK